MINEVYAVRGPSSVVPVRGMVLDERMWSYFAEDMRWNSVRGYIPRAQRRFRRRGRVPTDIAVHGRVELRTGLLVLLEVPRLSVDTPEAGDLVTVAQTVDSDDLEYLAAEHRPPIALQAAMDAERLELALVHPEDVQAPWHEHEMHASLEAVVAAAEAEVAAAADEIGATRRREMVADTERRLARAGFTYSTQPTLTAKPIKRCDVHADVDDERVTMTYATLRRLLDRIDGQGE